jgi:hypothetical protein
MVAVAPPGVMTAATLELETELDGDEELGAHDELGLDELGAHEELGAHDPEEDGPLLWPDHDPLLPDHDPLDPPRRACSLASRLLT